MLSTYCHPSGVVKPVYGIPTLKFNMIHLQIVIVIIYGEYVIGVPLCEVELKCFLFRSKVDEYQIRLTSVQKDSADRRAFFLSIELLAEREHWKMQNRESTKGYSK